VARRDVDVASLRAAAVLRALMSIAGASDRAVQRVTGCATNWVYSRKVPRNRWLLDDVRVFAAVFDVPEHVFLMDEQDFWLWWSVHNRPLTLHEVVNKP
jgi:hypothetical protein